MAKGNSGKSKSQRRDDLERKRDERSRRNAMKKEKQIKEYLDNDENCVSFKNQLETIGFKIKDILGDGNCLFRALGDQLNGDHTSHIKHRNETVKYMKNHCYDFEPFMEDDTPFDKHLELLSRLGTYGGNDSIVAFARNHGVDIVIHQLNERRWVINGSEYSTTGQKIELNISYHNGEHYSSVRRISDPGTGPAWLYHDSQSMDRPKAKGVGTKVESCKGQKKKERREDQHIKDDLAGQEGAACSTCNGDIPSPEETVTSATGCQDLPLVIQTLEENNFNIDVSISYILQIMCLRDEEECCVSEYPNNGDVIQNLNGVEDREDNSPWIKDQISSCSSQDDSNPDVAKTKGQSCSTENTNCTQTNDCEPCGKRESSITEDKENAASDPIVGKPDLKEFVHNLRDTINGVSCQTIHPGARPKQTVKPKSIKNNSHISNRLRKELARQEKKKRREERRKEEGTGNEILTVPLPNGTVDGVAMVTADLGAVAI